MPVRATMTRPTIANSRLWHIAMPNVIHPLPTRVQIFSLPLYDRRRTFLLTSTASTTSRPRSIGAGSARVGYHDGDECIRAAAGACGAHAAGHCAAWRRKLQAPSCGKNPGNVQSAAFLTDHLIDDSASADLAVGCDRSGDRRPVAWASRRRSLCAIGLSVSLPTPRLRRRKAGRGARAGLTRRRGARRALRLRPAGLSGYLNTAIALGLPQRLQLPRAVRRHCWRSMPASLHASRAGGTGGSTAATMPI